MTIAIPIRQNRISPLLDSASRLLLVDHESGRILKRREVVLEVSCLEALAVRIAELSVNTLLCAAISGLLLHRLRYRGIRVRPRLCGDVDEILAAYFSRQLGRRAFQMPGCWDSAKSSSRKNHRGETGRRSNPVSCHAVHR